MIIQLKLNIIETRYDDGKKKWKIKGNFANLEQNIEKKDLENLLMTINTDQVKRNPKIFNSLKKIFTNLANEQSIYDKEIYTLVNRVFRDPKMFLTMNLFQYLRRQ